MKRRIAVLAVFLLLGAVVNVAVAWAAVLASRPPATPSFGLVPDEDEAWWKRNAPAAVAADPNFFWVWSSRAARHVMLSGPQPGIESVIMLPEQGDMGLYWNNPHDVSSPWPGAWDQVLRVRAGWPMAGLEGECWYAALSWNAAFFALAPGASVPRLQEAALCAVVPLDWGLGPRPALLPLRPVWPGFAVNSVLNAVAIWLPFLAPGHANRWLRRLRGCCPACGYPAGASALCTECGRAQPS